MAEIDADVVVVGYGPVGMATAGLLAQAGHRVLVLERYGGLYNLPRAAIFDDEIMRTLDKLGIAQTMLPKVHVQHSYEWRNAAGDLLIEHHFADTGRSGWAEWYMMYQPELEEALDGVCRSFPGVEVRHSSPVVSLDQTPDLVRLQVVDPDGLATTVTARYVVACDGGNSATRRSLGVGQQDYGFSEPWMVCDFRLRRDVAIPDALQIGDPRQPTSVISLGPHHHRFSFMLDSEGDFEVQRNPELVWARVRDYLGPDDAELIRVATYTFRSLVADQWRVGRVVLAGDAAHQMPPFLGQGMCSGIRDALNLAFKLDLILRGRAPAGLLDTYQTEREPHVRAVIEKGIELGRIQTMRDPAAAAERDRRLLAQRAARQDPEKLIFPGLRVGMLASAQTAGRGELFVQYTVDDGARHGRFDDVVGRGFVVLTTPAGLADLRREGSTADLADAGVRVIAMSEHPVDAPAGTSDTVFDIDGGYTRWFADHGVSTVAVRPDFYVYGCADDRASVRELISDLVADLGGSSVRGAAAVDNQTVLSST